MDDIDDAFVADADADDDMTDADERRMTAALDADVPLVATDVELSI